MTASRFHRRAMMFVALLALVATGCGPGGVITLVVRPCVVQGSVLASASQGAINDAVSDLFDYGNNNIWNQAHISFLACCQDVPVIADPDPGKGRAGSIAMGARDTTEMANARDACALAWASKESTAGTGFTNGPIVIFASDLTDRDGYSIAPIGATSQQRTSPNTCVAPRALTAADVDYRYVIALEPAAFGYRGDQNHGSAREPLAHELGHVLLLEHGDGLDNDHNGTETPTSGARLFDVGCDNGEGAELEGGSLMAAVSGSTVLTPLQIELAREAAQVMPGHVGP